MYYYISIRSDAKHSQFIPVSRLMQVLMSFPSALPRSHASCVYALGEFMLPIRGIQADAQGCYAFSDDAEFSTVNLIEIDLPHGSETAHDAEIRRLAQAIADEQGWEVDWRE